MKICHRLKEIFLEDEFESWKKINKILIRSIIFNSFLFIILFIGLILKYAKISSKEVTNSSCTDLAINQEKYIFFNIGGQVFNFTQKILQRNNKSKLYIYYLNQIPNTTRKNNFNIFFFKL